MIGIYSGLLTIIDSILVVGKGNILSRDFLLLVFFLLLLLFVAALKKDILGAMSALCIVLISRKRDF